MWQASLELKTAFLNGVLEEEVYINQPPGFQNGPKDQVWRLHKSLYGLKQAPRAWHTELVRVLKAAAFAASAADPGLFINKDEFEEPVHLLTYVDDMLICSKNVHGVEEVKRRLAKEFEVHNLGEASHFLGCKATRERELGAVFWGSH